MGQVSCLLSVFVWMCGSQKTESSGWLEFKWFKAAPGQRSDVLFGLGSGSGSELTIPDLSSLVCHGFSFLSPLQRFLSLQSSSSAACQGSPLLTSRKPHFSCSLAAFSSFYFDPGWSGGFRAVAWPHTLPFQTHWWLRVLGAAPAGRMEPLRAHGDVPAGRTGRRAEQAAVGVQISSAAVAAPFPMASAMTAADGASSVQKSTLGCWLYPLIGDPAARTPWNLCSPALWVTNAALGSDWGSPSVLQKGSKALIPVTAAAELPGGEVQCSTCASGSSPLLCATIQHFTRITGTSGGSSPLNYLALPLSTRSITAIQSLMSKTSTHLQLLKSTKLHP